MWVNLWKSVNSWFVEFTKNIKDFFVENSRNPFLWVGIILIGLLIFETVYKALHRD